MPVELLVPFLAEHYVSVNLRVALQVIYRFGNEMHSPLSEEIFRGKVFFKIIINRALKRHRRRIPEVSLLPETDTVDPVAALRDTVVSAVQHLEIDIVAAVILECLLNDLPGPVMIMHEHAPDVLKDKYFRLAFNNEPCKLAEQSAAGILETAVLPSQRKSLAGNSAHKQVYLSPERSGIEITNI